MPEAWAQGHTPGGSGIRLLDSMPGSILTLSSTIHYSAFHSTRDEVHLLWSYFSPPFHNWACEQLWENCDYIVEAVEALYLCESLVQVIEAPAQFSTSCCFRFPCEKRCPDAILDHLSTFPEASTTVSKGRVFH